MTELKQRGGAGRGQGRKRLAKTGELMKARPIRMTDGEWEKCKRIGGAAWVRAVLKRHGKLFDRLSADRGALLDAIYQLPNDLRCDPGVGRLLEIARRIEIVRGDLGEE